MFLFEQGGWDTEEGRCSVSISMETKFSKKTMWHKAIESGSKSANEKGMRDLMHMVRSNTAVRSAAQTSHQELKAVK